MNNNYKIIQTAYKHLLTHILVKTKTIKKNHVVSKSNDFKVPEEEDSSDHQQHS
jgi:hypothetical protein